MPWRMGFCPYTPSSACYTSIRNNKSIYYDKEVNYMCGTGDVDPVGRLRAENRP